MTAALFAGVPGLPAPALTGIGWLLLPVAWVGHACIWTASLNYLYGRPLPKWFLKPYRLLCGGVIVGFPAGVYAVAAWGWPLGGFELFYLAATATVGGGVFPVITLERLLRRKPAAVVAEATETVDFYPSLSKPAIGDGRYAWVPRLPGLDTFRVDFTRLTLALDGLPPAWDGLTVLLLSDLHFHGTPARCFFDAVIDTLTAGPVPDLVILAGDYVDDDAHISWIEPILGRLTAAEGKYAVVGNHDQHHHPDRVRAELLRAGYRVLGNGWQTSTIRDEPLVMIGHEGPWFGPEPDPSQCPPGFRLLVSHTPDNFYWAQRHGVNLMLSGHVHGGQIRLPVIGPIFVPSVYGRRFDGGVYEGGGTVMAVGRGLSGKEPLRINCRPQVLTLTLRPGERGASAP